MFPDYEKSRDGANMFGHQSQIGVKENIIQSNAIK